MAYTIRREFACARCGKIFTSETPEEEAVAELSAHFGAVPVDQRDVVCDDCWEVVRPDR